MPKHDSIPDDLHEAALQYDQAVHDKARRLEQWRVQCAAVHARLEQIRAALAARSAYFKTAKVTTRAVTYGLADGQGGAVVYEDPLAPEVVFMSGNVDVHDLSLSGAPNGTHALTRFECGFEVRFFPQLNGIVNCVALGHQLRDDPNERPGKVLASFEAPEEVTDDEIDDCFEEALEYVRTTTHLFHPGYERENGWETKVIGFRREARD
jgi:hypothetical protein